MENCLKFKILSNVHPKVGISAFERLTIHACHFVRRGGIERTPRAGGAGWYMVVVIAARPSTGMGAALAAQGRTHARAWSSRCSILKKMLICFKKICSRCFVMFKSV